MPSPTDPGGSARAAVRLTGLFLGPAACAVLLLLPVPDGLSPLGWRTAAVAVWMAVWWASEAVPLAVTALLPLALLPLFGIADIGAAAAPFANPLIFLFLGGFLIALAMQRWNLHRRIALMVLARAGARPRRLVGAAMLATAFLSMWISNTATAMMMLPIAASLVALVEVDRDDPRRRGHFAVALMLGIAYAASIGGLGTLIGSPPNALLASFMGQTYGVRITFTDWMMLGVPVAAVMLPLAWLVLTRLAYPFDDTAHGDGAAAVADAVQALGRMSPAERRVAGVALLVALGWVAGPWLGRWLPGGAPSDTVIAIAGAVALFVVPADWKRRVFLLDWAWASRAPWHVLLLFGGGLSLAGAIDRSGLAAWIGGGLDPVAAWPLFALIVAVAALVIFLTELTSNTATTAAFLPVVGAVAVGAGLDPLLLAAPAALAASCAFMLPVATPPNAIVYSTGHVNVAQMIRAGIVLNAIGIAVIAGLAAILVPLIAG
ncbi:MAG: DASS family sodium-coupled anion symporter [Alphaproteobacteria bacterium]